MDDYAISLKVLSQRGAEKELARWTRVTTISTELEWFRDT